MSIPSSTLSTTATVAAISPETPNFVELGRARGFSWTLEFDEKEATAF